MEDLGQIIVFDIPNNMMTGSMMRREREEFNELLKKHKEIELKRRQSYLVYTSKDKVGENGSRTIKMEAFDWQPERLLIYRYNLQNFVQKRKLNTSDQHQQQQPERTIGFTKAGCSDVTGNDYFNQVSEQFSMSLEGDRQVKKAPVEVKIDDDKSEVAQ